MHRYILLLWFIIIIDKSWIDIRFESGHNEVFLMYTVRIVAIVGTAEYIFVHMFDENGTRIEGGEQKELTKKMFASFFLSY